MFNKNDPLIGAVQEVMKKNQAERDAIKAVNEKFGVVDRRALPHEQQANWDAAYKKVMTEGVQTLKEAKEPWKKEGSWSKQMKRQEKSALKKLTPKAKEARDKAAEKPMDEELSPKQQKLAAIAGDKKKIDAPDLAAARAGKAKHIEEEEQLDEISKQRLGSYIKQASDDKATAAADHHIAAKKKGVVQKELASDNLKRFQKRSKGISMAVNKLTKEEKIEEKAKWRSTSVAKKVTSPDDPDSVSYDYHHDNPRSTGAMRATSDKPDSYDGLNNRRKSDVVSRGERKGKITKDSANRLKDRIVSNHFQKEEKIDEVAPPGREDQVKSLKKKVGTERAFKIAWASYNKKKGK